MITVSNGGIRILGRNKRFSDIIPLLYCVLLCSMLISCGGNGAKTQQEDFQSASAVLDGIGEESPGDSVDSAYLKSMLHSGQKVLLNFCYCCDCKFTKPLLNAAIEKGAIPVTMITVDVKEHFDIADEYGVRQSPFYILFDETGQQVDTLYGFQGDDLMDSAGIRKWLEKNLAKPKGD